MPVCCNQHRLLDATPATSSRGLVLECSVAGGAYAGLAADEDVFDLIKQEVQRDAQGKKKRPAGKLQLLVCSCAFIMQHHLAIHLESCKSTTIYTVVIVVTVTVVTVISVL